MYFRANQSPQSIFLTTKALVYPNLVGMKGEEEHVLLFLNLRVFIKD